MDGFKGIAPGWRSLGRKPTAFIGKHFRPLKGMVSAIPFFMPVYFLVQVRAGRRGGGLSGKRYKYIPVRCASAIPWLQSFPERPPPRLPALTPIFVAGRVIGY